MIRILKETDRIKVLDYLYKEPALNIFIIGDIEAFGFEKDFQTLYGEFNKNNEYISVMLFYREHSIFYSHDSSFNEDWLKIMDSHKFENLSGRKSVIDKIKIHLLEFENQNMYFAEVKEINFKENFPLYKIKKAKTNDDMSKLYDLLITIPEFGIQNQSKQQFIDSKKLGLKMGVTYYIEENNVILSTVATTAETTINAMVVAVATKETARKRGLASILTKYLIEEYINEKGKYLCLFYDNPLAGNIYKRLGFKDIDQWSLLKKRINDNTLEEK